MARLQLVCSLLFICLISCTASPSDLSSETPLAQIDKMYFGAAKILYDGEHICSGIHIKPWIVLTIADCVNGRDVNSLEAGVMKDKKENKVTRVSVESVTIYYKYKPGKPENNFALLNIYCKADWNVYEFQFTSHFMTYDELWNANNTQTLYVDKWLPNGKVDKDFYMEWKYFYIYKNDGVCGTCMYDNCYCGNYSHYNPEYYKVDVGTPLYYGDPDEKMILGLDTGTAQAEARVFQEVYSIKSWVRDFVRFHCAPPDDKL